VFRVSLQHLSETFFILRRRERDLIKNVHWSSCEVPFILFRAQRNLNFLYRFSKDRQILNLVKIRAVGAELFHADIRTDGRTDRSKLIAAFRNFANAPKMAGI
jgi:hypothetical protein